MGDTTSLDCSYFRHHALVLSPGLQGCTPGFGIFLQNPAGLFVYIRAVKGLGFRVGPFW